LLSNNYNFYWALTAATYWVRVQPRIGLRAAAWW